MLHIGCHLSVSGGYEHMGREALSIGADTFQYFSRNPRGGGVNPFDPEDADRLIALMEENRFAPVLTHAPYTLNPCAQAEATLDFARRRLAGAGTAVVFVMLSTVIGYLFGIINPIFARFFMDRLLTGENRDLLMPFLGLLAALSLAQVAVAWVQAI